MGFQWASQPGASQSLGLPLTLGYSFQKPFSKMDSSCPAEEQLQIHKQAHQKQAKCNLTQCHHRFLLNYMIINHFVAISGSSLHQQLQSIQQKGVWAEPVQEEEKGEEPPLNNMGALSILTSGILQPTEEKGIKTKRHHVQVNVRGRAERKCRITTAYLHVCWFNSEPEFTYAW